MIRPPPRSPLFPYTTLSRSFPRRRLLKRPLCPASAADADGLAQVTGVLRRVEQEGRDRAPGRYGAQRRARRQAAGLRTILFVAIRNQPGRARDGPFDRGALDDVLHRLEVTHVRSKQEPEDCPKWPSQELRIGRSPCTRDRTRGGGVTLLGRSRARAAETHGVC